MKSVKDQQNAVLHFQQSFRSRPLMKIRELQAYYPKEAPVRGQVWISQDRFKSPIDSDLCDVVLDIVESVKNGDEKLPRRADLTLQDVPLEWIGYRASTDSRSKQPSMSDHEIFQRLCKDQRHAMTVLYVHGGAFYVGNPVYCRPSTTRLAKLLKARVASISYRLAPQHTFPAALLDVLTSWLRLLYPGEHSVHDPVNPDMIVLAGDSAGGNLCLAMIQVILQMRKRQKTDRPRVWFDGKKVEVSLPRGITVLSPWADMSLSLPSWLANSDIDFLQDAQPALSASQPSDDVWPTNPPRGDFYCDQSAWIHPIVCPAMARDWSGAPPLWIVCGQERCADGIKLIASRFACQGVPTMFSEYRGMPHIFPAVINGLPQTQRCYRDWATACLHFFENGSRSTTRGEIIDMPGDSIRQVDPKSVFSIPPEEVTELVTQGSKRRMAWIGSAEAKL